MQLMLVVYKYILSIDYTNDADNDNAADKYAAAAAAAADGDDDDYNNTKQH